MAERDANNLTPVAQRMLQRRPVDLDKVTEAEAEMMSRARSSRRRRPTASHNSEGSRPS
jgi:hypothetical protein